MPFITKTHHIVCGAFECVHHLGRNGSGCLINKTIGKELYDMGVPWDDKTSEVHVQIIRCPYLIGYAVNSWR